MSQEIGKTGSVRIGLTTFKSELMVTLHNRDKETDAVMFPIGDLSGIQYMIETYLAGCYIKDTLKHKCTSRHKISDTILRCQQAPNHYGAHQDGNQVWE